LIQSIDMLATALGGTSLQGRAVRELWPSDSLAPVYAVPLQEGQEADELAVLGSLVEKTGRWPLLTRQDLAELIFLDEPPPASHLTRGHWADMTAAKALAADGATFVSSGGHLREFSPTQTTHLFDWLDVPLDHGSHPISKIRKRFGDAPSVQQIRDLRSSGTVHNDAELERWLLDWELQRFGEAALLPEYVGYLDGGELSDGAPGLAILPPTAESWKAFLYMGWYGLESAAAERAAALRMWGEAHGAALTQSFATTLHLSVKNRPRSVDAAFALALEHFHFASDTLVLPGISIRDHARALLCMDRWFFHSRP
jgi:hypothetical protein